MPKDDGVYLGHMLDKAQQAIRLVQGKTREEYKRDETLQLALAHILQTIGEAACRVSSDYRSAHPELPWKDIMGMRHRIVHDYMDVDEDIVWETVQKDLGPLELQLRSLLPPDAIDV